MARFSEVCCATDRALRIIKVILGLPQDLLALGIELVFLRNEVFLAISVNKDVTATSHSGPPNENF